MRNATPNRNSKNMQMERQSLLIETSNDDLTDNDPIIFDRKRSETYSNGFNRNIKIPIKTPPRKKGIIFKKTPPKKNFPLKNNFFKKSVKKFGSLKAPFHPKKFLSEGIPMKMNPQDTTLEKKSSFFPQNQEKNSQVENTMEHTVEVVFYQKIKRKKNDRDKWSLFIEDVSKINTPEKLQARDSLESLILDLVFVKTMAQFVNSNDVDQLCSALVTLYHRNNKTMDLWEPFVIDEIEKTDLLTTLFRNNNFTTKILSNCALITGMEYLKNVITPLIHSVLKSSKQFEIDPKVVTDPHILKSNFQHLADTCEIFLTNILESFSQMPIEMKYICHVMLREINQKFPNQSQNEIFIGGFIFLR